jgi:hypothetical protein
MNRISLRSILSASIVSFALLFAAVPAANALLISYDFLGTPDVTVGGVTVGVSSPDGNILHSATQGYGVLGGEGGALDIGEIIDFGFSDGGGALNVTLKEISFFLANSGEKFSVSLSSGGGLVNYTFPTPTDPNVSVPFDVSGAGLFGDSFRITNTMTSYVNSFGNTVYPNFRISGIAVETIPDGGITLMLLGLGLGGLAILRRKLA